MSGIEIKQAVLRNNQRIEELLTNTDIFELNPEIAQFIAKNQILRQECKKDTGHNFINGYCEYCGEEER